MHKTTTMMMLSLAALLAFPSATMATPNAPHADRGRVELALSAYHRPPTARQLMMLGPDVAEVLRDIVEVPRGNRLARNRALSALAHFPGVETQSVLENVLRETASANKGMAVLDLSKALPSYAAVVGPKATKTVAPYLSHAIPELRVAAAMGLRLSKATGARALIVARLQNERSASTRKALKAQISAMDHTAALR